MAAVTLLSLDPSALLNYYAARLPMSTQAAAAAQAASTSAKSATANDQPPWETAAAQPAQEVLDAQVLGTTKFLDLSKVPPGAGGSPDQKTEQDNQKLFALYQAVNTLSNLSNMAKRDGMTAGQLQGLNARFQNGLSQVQDFLKTASFNGLTLQAGQTSASVTSTVAIPFPPMSYTGGTVVNDAGLKNALPGLSASDKFDIGVTKNGATSALEIDLSQVQGPLTLDNVVRYINQQLAAAGDNSRFSRVITQGSIDDPTKATYGIAIDSAPGEKLSLSSPQSTPALYLAETTGSATGAKDNPISDRQARLIKLTGLDGSPQAAFNATANPDTGATTAQATAVDANGNVYLVGNATGDFGNQLNQGAQDVFLSKYDSAGNLLWTKLLGSAGTANGYALAIDPKGGVVVAGSTTADLSPGAVADGNADSFIASYDGDGNQSWVKQIPTLNTNQATALSVDASGNVFIGGQVTGVIGKGQASAGKSDGYLAKLDSTGKIVSEQQFGTSGADQVAATALTSDGGLVVASVQNGHAILSKYANGDPTAAPVWTQDLGDLQNGGAIGGLAVSGNTIYLSGNATNAALDGGATVASASSGGADAFVASFTDNGSSATANTISYVGTSGAEKAGALTVGSDGTVYLTGTTTGTFAGQTRNQATANNMFVSALAPDGSIEWAQQYGGTDGQSAGAGIAIDTQGSSVLDALGLPRGAISISQDADLEAQTTLRAGDTFDIQLQGVGARTATIAIEQGDTLATLANRINIALLNAGAAKVSYASGGKTLQIKLNPGFTAALAPGSADFDALARLGISPGTLSAPGKTSTGSAAASSAGNVKQAFGLGFTGKMDISTASGAGAARAQLLNVLSAIRNAYRTTNTPATSAGAATQSSGPAPAYLTSQVANYTLALNMMMAGSSSGTTA